MPCPNVAPRWRLRGKTKPSVAKRVVPQTSKTGKGLRAAAVAQGLCPKARRPFALFLQQHSMLRKGDGSSRQQHQFEMRRISALWKALPPAQKDEWKLKSAEETRSQREALASQGIFMRGRRKTQKEGFSLQPEEACPSEEARVSEYRLGPVLGHGSYGKVYFGRSTASGRPAAIKIFTSRHGQEEMQRETTWHTYLQKNLKFADYQACFPVMLGEEPNARPFPWYSMQHAGLSIDVLLRQGERFAGDKFKCLTAQLASSLKLLHALHICHLDLKPANLLWSEPTQAMKLADVGMMEFDEVMAGNKEPDFLAYVTETYRPPELFQCDISRKHLRAAVDTYSAGMTLYEALVGKAFMRPISAQHGILHSVKGWCEIVHQDLCCAGARRLRRPMSQAQSAILCRYYQAGSWGPLILQASHPDIGRRSLPPASSMF